MKNNWLHIPKIKIFKHEFITSLTDDTYTVCVKYHNGTISEYSKIENPWKYIAKTKKSFNVEDAWIKNKE